MKRISLLIISIILLLCNNCGPSRYSDLFGVRNIENVYVKRFTKFQLDSMMSHEGLPDLQRWTTATLLDYETRSKISGYACVLDSFIFVVRPIDSIYLVNKRVIK